MTILKLYHLLATQGGACWAFWWDRPRCSHPPVGLQCCAATAALACCPLPALESGRCQHRGQRSGLCCFGGNSSGQRLSSVLKVTRALPRAVFPMGMPPPTSGWEYENILLACELKQQKQFLKEFCGLWDLLHLNYSTKVCQHKAKPDEEGDPNLLSIESRLDVKPSQPALQREFLPISFPPCLTFRQVRD